MKGTGFHFTTGLIALGFVLAGAVAFDLFSRGLHRHPSESPWPHGEADLRRGREAIVVHGCGACHVVPGVSGATGRVGPKLEEFSQQMYIAGVLPNTPENLADWIRDPRRHNPRTAMPDMDIDEQDAHDIAAYLYSLQ